MQNRVLDAAYVLIDRQPILRGPGIHWLRSAGVAEPREIPRGIHKCVQRVRLAPRAGPALGTVCNFPAGMMVKRVAGTIEPDIVREEDREFVLGDRQNTATIAMDDGNGTAPKPLAGNKPVAQTILNCGSSLPRILEALRDFRPGGIGIQLVEKSRIGDPSRSRIGLVADCECSRCNAVG